MPIQCFNKGDAIEVLKTNPFTIWFPATVLRSTPTRNGQIYVEFLHESSRSRREYVNAGYVRPSPPSELHRYFKVGDTVEVLYKGKGWRNGKVNDVLENSMYLVSLDEEDIVKVEQWGLRVYRVWDDGSWVPPLHLQQKNIPEVELKSRGVKLRIKCSRSWKETFSEGMSVEVKRDKKGFYGSWHTAVIVKPVGYDKFLVEYQKPKTVNGSQFLKEEVDASCIRPCPPEIRSFHPFEHLDRVDAWFNDGWWEAQITEVLGGSNYVVCLLTTEEELVFEHSMLRPHQEWSKGKWVTAREFDMIRSPSDMRKSKELKIRIKCSGRTSEPKFSKGMKVEVKSDEEGYQGSWYTAVIVNSIGQQKFLVEYLTLRTEDESKPLKEKADASDIRPCPRVIQRIDRFKMLEEVDAWYNEGWWVGLICKILDGLKYMVYFWTTNEELEFDHFTLRPHQEWIDGKWVIAFMKKSEIQVKPKLGKLKGQNGGVARYTNFCVGAKVEVKSDEEDYQDSWYPATIVRPLVNGKYLLRYQTLETDDETDLLTEEADALSIRPSPPVIQQADQFRPLDEVDAWYNGGWWAGQVCKVLKGSNYMVYFRTSNEILKFQHSDLRPHQNWLDGEWIAAKRAFV
ncbi:hypothetical protein K7X08_010473 [Anisodus acutangulus]|uniref:Agenet domain-containing protein n=1 Tax=Anisodus acutangulus TaxID=402998 RepID=A0A9Q1N181_9SOLA|nr:hypothetical protein K7X08_010473 [Anisodus acutangulus]